jgi:outer membrane immunogenic protein
MKTAHVHATALVLALCAGGSTWAQTMPQHDWSGFHASGFLGAAHGQSEARTVTGRLQYFVEEDAVQIARAGDNKLGQSNISGGLALGWDKQFDRLLVGVEASANSLSFDKEKVRGEVYDSVPGTSFNIRQSVRASWMSAVRLRLGWAQGNWLAYVSGGVAHTKLKLDVTLTDNAFDGFSKASTSQSVTGPTVGFGGEYALDSKWSIRGDYHHTRFGSINTVSDVTSTNNSGGTLLHKANLSLHSVFVGLNYRFR